MSEKFDPNNPEHVMKRYGWSRKEFDKRMGIVAKYESQLTPLVADLPNGCDEHMVRVWTDGTCAACTDPETGKPFI